MEYQFHLKRILVPTDLSEHADQAIHHAAALAHRTQAELLVLHVVEKFMDHSLLYSDVWPYRKPVGDYYHDLEEKTQQMLEDKIRAIGGEGIDFRVLVTTGVPSAEIVAASGREKVDLIVIATHGRGGIAQALLGSTTDRVLRKANCPLLVIRSGAEGFVRPVARDPESAPD